MKLQRHEKILESLESQWQVSVGSLSTLLSREVAEIAQRWPVVIGEFGTGGRMDNNDSRNLMRYADENLSGWQAWNLSDIGPPVMLSSFSARTNPQRS
jgi:hypothetical protein